VASVLITSAADPIGSRSAPADDNAPDARLLHA
jgi:hypothetical protein